MPKMLNHEDTNLQSVPQYNCLPESCGKGQILGCGLFKMQKKLPFCMTQSWGKFDKVAGWDEFFCLINVFDGYT